MPSVARAGVPALLLALTFVLALTQIEDSDAWTHLALGRDLVERGQFPEHEPFTVPAAAAGLPYYNAEWLFGVVFYLAAVLGGLVAVGLLKAAIVTFAVWILWRQCQLAIPCSAHSGLRLFLPAAGLLPVVLMMRHRFVERPDIALMVFLAFTILALDVYLVTGRRGCLYALPFVQVLWVNVHPSSIVALVPFGAVLGAAGLAWAAQRWRGWTLPESPTPAQARVVGVVFAVFLAASLLNPYGVDALTLPFRLAGLSWFRAEIGELQRPLPGENPAPFVLAALIVTACALAWRRLPLAKVMLFMPFACLGLSANRFVFLLALIGGPILVTMLATALTTWNATRLNRVAVIVSVTVAVVSASIAGLAAAGVGPAAEPRKRLGVGRNDAYVPEGALRYLDARGLYGPVFNTFHWGGYIAWRDFPQRRPMVDGRGYLPPGILEEIHFARVYPAHLERLRATYGFDVAVLDYPMYFGSRVEDVIGTDADRGLASEAWALVYWDDGALVYLRRVEHLTPIIERDAYHFVRPANGVADIARLLARGPIAPAVVAELERNVTETGSSLGAVLRGFAAIELGAYDEAAEWLQRGRRGSRRLDAEQGLALARWRAGDREGAVQHYRTLLRERPHAQLRYQLGLLYAEGGEDRQAVAVLERARRDAPGFAPLYAALAASYRRLGDREREVGLGPDFLKAVIQGRVEEHVRRALALQRENRTAEARAELEAALALDAGNAVVHSHLGYLHLHAGRLDAAHAAQQVALAADPRLPQAHYALALVHERRGDLAAARRHLSTFVQLEPRSYEAWRVRAELRRLSR